MESTIHAGYFIQDNKILKGHKIFSVDNIRTKQRYNQIQFHTLLPINSLSDTGTNISPTSHGNMMAINLPAPLLITIPNENMLQRLTSSKIDRMKRRKTKMKHNNQTWNTMFYIGDSQSRIPSAQVQQPRAATHLLKNLRMPSERKKTTNKQQSKQTRKREREKERE